MPDDDVADPRKSGSPMTSRNTEPTQRFSALQQQLVCAAIHFFHRHIRSDPEVLQRMEGNQMFRLFFEVQYHSKPDLNRIFPESVHDCSALHVSSFILSILHQGIFGVSAFIVGVIYLSRFKESSHITLHACTWRPLFLTSLLLADKMLEDKPVRNSSLAKLFPVLSNTELNKLESEFLTEIRFNVIVKPDLFCSFCEKLLAETVHPDIIRCVSQSEYAETLQADMVDNCAPTAKPAPTGKELAVQQQLHQEQQQQQQQQQQNRKHQSSMEKMQQQATPTTARPALPLSTRATVGGHPNHTQRPRQAWLEQGVTTGSSGTAPPGRSGAGASVAAPSGLGSEALAPRSQSAGPTTNTSSRRANSQASTPQVRGPQLGGPHQQQANNDSQRSSLRPGGNAMAAAVAAAREAALGTGSSPNHGQIASATRAQSGQQQTKRSISVHPLNRNNSIKKHPSGKADDVNEARSARPAGGICEPLAGRHGGHPPPPQPVTSGLGGMGGAPLRRSLPAKTSISAFVPLARTPSAAGGASSSVSAALGGTSRGTSVAPPSSHSGSAARESAGSRGSPRKGGTLLSAGRGRESPRRVGVTSSHGSSAGRPQGQSPRSPTGFWNTTGQPSRATLPSHFRSHGEASGWGEGRVTPPAPVLGSSGSVSSAKFQEARGVSPADGSAGIHHGTQGAGGRSGSNSLGLGQPVAPRGSSQPTRASSASTPAPRMNSTVQRQTGPAAPQSGHGQSSPSMTSPVPSNSPTKQQAHLGHCSPPVPANVPKILFPNSPAVRGASTNTQVLMNAPRGATGSGSSGHTAAASAIRNLSPVGLSGPNSPQHILGGHQVPLSGMSTQGYDRLGQQRGADALGETGRGRSPPQSMAGANGCGSSTALRQPRAITPSSLVKGITQGIHAGGMVTRDSLGPPAAAHHRPMF